MGIGFSDHLRGEQRVGFKCTDVFLGDVSVGVGSCLHLKIERKPQISVLIFIPLVCTCGKISF